jgi:hypothetical protein
MTPDGRLAELEVLVAQLRERARVPFSTLVLVNLALVAASLRLVTF